MVTALLKIGANFTPLPQSTQLVNIENHAISLARSESEPNIGVRHLAKALFYYRGLLPSLLPHKLQRSEALDTLTRKNPLPKFKSDPDTGELPKESSALDLVMKRANEIAHESGRKEVSPKEGLIALAEFINAMNYFDSLNKDERAEHLKRIHGANEGNSKTIESHLILLNREIDPVRKLFSNLTPQYIEDFCADPNLALQKLKAGEYQFREYRPNPAMLDLSNVQRPILNQSSEGKVINAGHKVTAGESVKQKIEKKLAALDPLMSEETIKTSLIIIDLLPENPSLQRALHKLLMEAYKNKIQDKTSRNKEASAMIESVSRLKYSLSDVSYDKTELKNQIKNLRRITRLLIYNPKARSILVNGLKPALRNALEEAKLTPLIISLLKYDSKDKLRQKLYDRNEPRFDIGSSE